MCYGDNVPALSLEAVHVACLCGGNGSGKSSLLDAMTWALWGKSRADSDDDLVRQGQTEAEVDFVFSVRGQSYRVLRKHSRAARGGTSVLTLQSLAQGAARDISGNTKTETQAKLIELLGLDYKTFRNSAYLVQGSSNEFSVADPAERKRVLATILELTQYDELCELARARANDKNGLAGRLQALITNIDAELAAKPSCQEDLLKLGAQLASADKKRSDSQQILSTIESFVQGLEIKRSELKGLEAHQDELLADSLRWKSRLADLERQIGANRSITSAREEIERGHAGLRSLQADNAKLNEKARQMLELSKESASLQLAVQQARNELVNEHLMLQTKLREDRAKADSVARLAEEKSKLDRQMSALMQGEESISAKHRQLAGIQADMANLAIQNEKLASDAKQLEGKLAMLANSGARCPLCDSELGEGGLERVRQTYQEDRREKLGTLKSNRARVETLLSTRRTLEAEMVKAEPALRAEKAAKQGRIGQIEREISEAAAAAESIKEAILQVNGLEKRLAGADFAHVQHQALQAVSARIAELAYDTLAHERVKNDLENAAHWEAKWARLDEAARQLPQLEEEAATATRRIGELDSALQRDKILGERLRLETEKLPAALAEKNMAKESVEEAVQEEKGLREQLAIVRERLRRCDQLEQDRSTRAGELASALEEEGLYRQLGEAFGKKGIQALLIEKHLGDIQNEADRLLKKLTDNRMSIAINTQKETKKGTVVETLEIQVADELGTRRYEMFSGGEAFRIDFAIRIAISRLLTHRAGASLSTLFIDEGFGTQDAAGREKLVEAINSIQDEFEKIIVITHMEELKDAFPTRIEVTRSPTGSTISLT